MPGIVTLPSAPNTGLAGLGQVLLASGADYAQEKRTTHREAELRAQRLEDIASERAYETQTHTRNRGEHLADVADERAYAEKISEHDARLAFAKEMIRTGYLAPGGLTDPKAIDEAATRFAHDGLAARYMEAIKSGDLTYADLGDAQRVAAGLAKFSDRQAKHTQFQEGLPGKAEERAGQLVGERDQLLRTSSDLERRLAEPEPAPTQQQVAQLAIRLAQQNKKPGEMPSVAEIAQAAPQAEDTIRSQMTLRWNQQRQDALVQRSLLQDRLKDVSAELNTLTNRFGVVGVAGPNGAAPVDQPTGQRLGFDHGTQFPRPSAPPDLATAQKNFAANIAAELAKGRPQPAPNGTASRLNEPVSGPTYVAEPSLSPSGTRANEAVADTMRSVGYGVGNLFRPSSWHRNYEPTLGRDAMPLTDPAASVFTYEPSADVQVQQLKSRLAAMVDQRSPAAVDIKNRLLEIERRNAQLATRRSQTFADPITTFDGTTPFGGRPMMDSRLLEPAL